MEKFASYMWQSILKSVMHAHISVDHNNGEVKINVTTNSCTRICIIKKTNNKL